MGLKYYCKNFNCNNIICYRTYKNGSGLCRSCAGKLVKRNRMKENNSNFKGGKPKCKNCGKILSSYIAKLCRQCYLLKHKINISKIQLIDFYIKQKLSSDKIAKIFNCTDSSIFNKLHKYKIKVRSKTENYGGKGNPNFKGMVRKCIDCKKIINPYTKNTKRCQQCHLKFIAYKPNYCIDCGKEISKQSKRCFLCQYKSRRGKNNPMYGRVGKLNPMYGKIARHSKGNYYKGIWMRSSWEVDFAFFLYLSGIKYQYEPKAFDLGNMTYTPDFYIPKWNLYIEIKGYWRNDALIKFKLFKKQNPKIRIKVLMKPELEKLGVL